MTDQLKQIIDHETAITTLSLLAERLDIEIPTDPRMVRFFLVRIENTVTAQMKHAKAGNVLIDAMKAAINGR